MALNWAESGSLSISRADLLALACHFVERLEIPGRYVALDASSGSSSWLCSLASDSIRSPDVLEPLAEIAELVLQFPDRAILLHGQLRVAVRRPDLLVVAAEGVGLLPGLLAGRQIVEFRRLGLLLGVAGVAECRVEGVEQVRDRLGVVDLGREESSTNEAIDVGRAFLPGSSSC